LPCVQVDDILFPCPESLLCMGADHLFTCSYGEARRQGRAHAPGDPSLIPRLQSRMLPDEPSCRMLPPCCRTYRLCVVCSRFRRCPRFSLELHYCCPYSKF
jgi:hypothetical protein